MRTRRGRRVRRAGYGDLSADGDYGFAMPCVPGAASFGTLAVSYGRRHRTPWTPAWIGLLGAPLLLGLILAVAPAILRALGLMPG